jgi:hypothetical protein
MTVALAELIGTLQLLHVLVLNPERPADLVHDILIGSRVVASRGLVARVVGLRPICIDISGRECRTAFGMSAKRFQDFRPSRTGCGGVPVQIERGRWGGEGFLQDSTRSLQAWRRTPSGRTGG